MATIVSETQTAVATSTQAEPAKPESMLSPAEVRKLESYVELLAVFRESESRVTEAKVDLGAAILAFLQEMLEGLEADKRDNRRAVLVATLSDDTGLAKPDLARLAQAAALCDWFAEQLPAEYDCNPLLGVSWRVVSSVLIAVCNRDREQAGECYAVNVHADSVAQFIACVARFAENPLGIDKARQALSDARILGLDSKPVWVVITPQAADKAGKANTGEVKTAPADKPEAGQAEAAKPPVADVASHVSDCHKPGDFAGKAFQAVLACSDRDKAFRSLGQQSAAYAVALLSGLADSIVNCERDADGLELAKRCFLGAAALQAACVGAFPKLSELKKSAK